MKTKAKLLLAISTLSAVVLAAGVTSTFAWFTTKNTATLGTGTMTVSTVSNITVNVTKLGYDTATVPGTGAWNTALSSVVDANVALGPVSSIDGLKFYAPKALNDGSSAYGAADMGEVTTKTAWTGTTGVSNQYVGYVKYGIHVEAGADSGLPRTLKYKITPTVTDPELTNCYRVAFYKANSSWVAGTKIGIYANDDTDKTGWKYASSTYSTDTYETAEISDVADATAISPAVTTAAAISEYYIFSVWVEGADTDATNDKISAATLSVAIEFSLE